ncbi:MAG: protoglobin domain-containing protein [Proteobacteria bacterium]|nr:protoglobin domain-containing protein [Pseudomonadota bacterium]
MAPTDLEHRLRFMKLGDDEFRTLAGLRPALEAHADEFVQAFYRHLLTFPETRALLRNPDVRKRLLEQQRRYLLGLARASVTDDTVAELRRIGEVHARIGLEPRWYLGAYSLYFSLLAPLVRETLLDRPEEVDRALAILQSRLLLDAQLAIEAYLERHEQDLESLNSELARANRALEASYASQQRELTETTRRARAAEELASMGTLVAGLAHEIGTPMGVIQGHAKLLEPAVGDERARWRLKTIQEQIGRISRIIESLLNMARPKKQERAPVDLEALMETTLSFLSEKFDRRGVEVRRNFAPVSPVEGDSERLQQLCLNLFLNAVDAMPDGGELRVGLAPLDDGGTSLTVGDTGKGIPAADLERIFDPFFTSKAAGKGNGLGLTVVQGIAADHGGHIDARSRPGEGTTFEVYFPPLAGS